MIDLNTIPKDYQEAVDVLAAWQSGDDVTIYSMDDEDKKRFDLLK